jgi:hypothetical protein
MTVYIVFEFCGGHETEVDCVFSTEASTKQYISQQSNPDWYHYEEYVLDQC